MAATRGRDEVAELLDFFEVYGVMDPLPVAPQDHEAGIHQNLGVVGKGRLGAPHDFDEFGSGNVVVFHNDLNHF